MAVFVVVIAAGSPDPLKPRSRRTTRAFQMVCRYSRNGSLFRDNAAAIVPERHGDYGSHQFFSGLTVPPVALITALNLCHEKLVRVLSQRDRDGDVLYAVTLEP